MGRFVFITSIGIWLGTLVSFSYVFLPTIHATLSTNVTQVLLPRMFFRYHLIGLLCGLTALAAVSLAPLSASLPTSERLRLAFPVSVSLVCTLVMQYFLSPRLAQLRQQEDSAGYERVHRFTAMLNSTVLAMLVLAVAAIATR